jgi:hypothetical protein
MKPKWNLYDLINQGNISPAPHCHTAQLSQEAFYFHCHFVFSLSLLHAAKKIQSAKQRLSQI